MEGITRRDELWVLLPGFRMVSLPFIFFQTINKASPSLTESGGFDAIAIVVGT
jgi:hypothetical protein